MLVKELQRKDLNSLLTLYVLLEEQSVSKAADRLYLTQSAISKALGRLRDSFDDPLFVRAGQKLVPTPFAESLRQPLADILGQIQTLFSPDEFNPRTFKGEFKIGIVESLDMTFIPMFMEQVKKFAPNVVVITFSQLQDQMNLLQQGDLDFIIAPRFDMLEEDFGRRFFYQDRAVVVAREGHPLRDDAFTTMEACMEYSRVQLHTPDFQRFAVIREELYRLRKFWPIGFETDNMITALGAVAKTDLLLPCPALIMLFASEHINVRPLAIKNFSQPILEHDVVFAKRVETSAAHMWMLDFIVEAGKKFSEQTRMQTRQFNARLKI